MKIILSPIATFQKDNPPTVNGEKIIYRGETYDLALLPEGGEVEAELPFIGKIIKSNGIISLTLQFFYDLTLAEPNQSTNWGDYTFDITEGICPNPIVYKAAQEDLTNDN